MTQNLSDDDEIAKEYIELKEKGVVFTEAKTPKQMEPTQAIVGLIGKAVTLKNAPELKGQVGHKSDEGYYVKFNDGSDGYFKKEDLVVIEDSEPIEIFKAETKGGKYAIKAFKEANGAYFFTEYKDGSATGQGNMKSKDDLELRLNMILDGSAKIDGINYEIQKNIEDLVLLPINKNEPYFSTQQIKEKIEAEKSVISDIKNQVSSRGEIDTIKEEYDFRVKHLDHWLKTDNKSVINMSVHDLLDWVEKHPELYPEYIKKMYTIPKKFRQCVNPYDKDFGSEAIVKWLDENKINLLELVDVKEYSLPKYKPFSVSPEDKVFMKIHEDFIGWDELRPILMQTNFTESGVVSTNAFVMLFTKYRGDSIPKLGRYCHTEKCIKANEEAENKANYPQWERIIPHEQSNKAIINVESLYDFIKNAINLDIANPATKGITLTYNGEDISFNAIFLLDNLKALVELGHHNLEMGFSAKNRAATIYPVGQSDSVYSLKTDFSLIMPIFMGYGDNIAPIYNLETNCCHFQGNEKEYCFDVEVKKAEKENKRKEKDEKKITELTEKLEKEREQLKLEKIADKIMGIDSVILDKLNIDSGSKLYDSFELQKKYKDSLQKGIDRKFDFPLPKAVHDILEDSNFHALNGMLSGLGYYGEKEKENYIEFLKALKPESKQYYLSIDLFVEPPVQEKDSDEVLEWKEAKETLEMLLKTKPNNKDWKEAIETLDMLIGSKKMREGEVMAEGGNVGELKVGDTVRFIQKKDKSIIYNGKILDISSEAIGFVNLDYPNTGRHSFTTYSLNKDYDIEKTNKYTQGGNIDKENYDIKLVNIRDINVGDTVFHEGYMRTVGKANIKNDPFMGTTLWGDNYRGGSKPVELVVFRTAKKMREGGGIDSPKMYKINNTTAIAPELDKFLYSLNLKDGYSNSMGTYKANLTLEQLNRLVNLLIAYDKNDNVYILNSVNDVVYDSKDARTKRKEMFSEYNKSESIELPSATRQKNLWLEGKEKEAWELFLEGGNQFNYTFESYKKLMDRALKGIKMAEGGSIPNNYEGKTAKEVWGKWNQKQREHFLLDHWNSETIGIEALQGKSLKEISELDYTNIPPVMRKELEYHIEKGQYRKGGNLWIQDALSGKKGALRKTAMKKGLLKDKDDTLSKTDLKKLEKMGGKTAKRAYLAETLSSFKK